MLYACRLGRLTVQKVKFLRSYSLFLLGIVCWKLVAVHTIPAEISAACEMVLSTHTCTGYICDTKQVYYVLMFK